MNNQEKIEQITSIIYERDQLLESEVDILAKEYSFASRPEEVAQQIYDLCQQTTPDQSG